MWGGYGKNRTAVFKSLLGNRWGGALGAEVDTVCAATCRR